MTTGFLLPSPHTNITGVAFLTGSWRLKICLDKGIEVGLSIRLRVKSLEPFRLGSTEQPAIRRNQNYIVTCWPYYRRSVQDGP